MRKREYKDGINYTAIGADKVARETQAKIEQLYRAERIVRDAIGHDRLTEMGADYLGVQRELHERASAAREAYREATGEEWKRQG